MSNMGYCRFENTSTDMHDCVQAIANYSEDMGQLSRDEEFAVHQLAVYSVEFLKHTRAMMEDKLGKPIDLPWLINELSNGDCKALTRAVRLLGSRDNDLE